MHNVKTKAQISSAVYAQLSAPLFSQHMFSKYEILSFCGCTIWFV